MTSKKLVLATLATAFFAGTTANAQTGVDDDRVSLPSGPGSIEGVGDDVEIDPNMGAMSHSVAINLPAGFPGASPSLGLSYSSAAGSGPVGIGWSMSVPSVQRMTSRGSPNYNRKDLFDVNGDELVRVGNDSGDLIYRSRFEKGFIRYRWVNDNSGADGYFVGENPNGSRSYFGADNAGTEVPSARVEAPDGTARYYLVETVDPFDNTVTYSHGTETGTQPLLTGIEWVKDGGGDTVYSVEIEYEARLDLLSDASQGVELTCADRVSNIIVRNGTEIIREYVLTYQDDTAAGGFSRLAQVEMYGVGGSTGGTLYPIVHSFEYSQALGVNCTGSDCDTPYLVPMGTVSASLESGFATLVDINGDALPDVLDTTGTGAHQIYLNQLTPNGSGGFDHIFSAGSALSATGSTIQLGGAVKTFDVNGDGRSDLLNTSSGVWLPNGGDGDWEAQETLSDVTALASFPFNQARFVDINDDKRVDLLTSTVGTTTLYRNDGDTFTSVSVNALEVAFEASQTVQFADMNGDGLNDPVELQGTGAVRYRLNLGKGNWGEWKSITGLTLTPTQRTDADWEDLNGDGISDLVVVGQTQIDYWINRNGDRFDAVETITSTEVPGLPARGAGVTVLYSDMNGNGSEDVVWFSAAGVTYLELFPRRPNLMTRIENGIGSVQKIAYTTAAEEASTAADASDPWTDTLSVPMQMVKTVDRYVTLTGNDNGTGLHEVTTFSYRDGFYDGVEKQYRGFEVAETSLAADAYQEAARTVVTFDVGRTAPHRNGLSLAETVYSDGDEVRSTTTAYMDCTVAEVPTPATLEGLGRKGVYHPCVDHETVVHKEGLASSGDWVSVRSEYDYDGYGNVTLDSQFGDEDVTGDELYTRKDYVTPSSRWLIGLVSRETVADTSNATEVAETLTYYDGDDFVGLSLGQATHGFVSRTEKRVDATTTIDEERFAKTAYGNNAVKIFPRGSVADDNTHRTTYFWDSTGFFLTGIEVHTVDSGDSPYRIREEIHWDHNFQKPSTINASVLMVGGVAETNPNPTTVIYDEFGRLYQRINPGDELATPSLTITYDLGDPFTRILMEGRSETNGDIDEVTVQCRDGRDRTYQARTQTATGAYQVTGFTAYNARGVVVESWQPYTSTSDACESTSPSGVLSSTHVYDGMARLLQTTSPGADVYGEDIVKSTVYLPLARKEYDTEDNYVGGAHADTPTTFTNDGLGRLLTIERSLINPAQQSEVSMAAMRYDSTGTFAGYETGEGMVHELTTDLLGRVTGIENPNFGATSIEYDAASNVVSRTDARGVEHRFTYDGMNRSIERYEEGNKEATLVTWEYDMRPDDCEITECTNLANKLVAVRYPLDLGNGAVESAVERFGYDIRQRMVFKARRFGELADLVTTMSYDNQDRPLSVISPDGTTVSMIYDGMGRLASVPGYINAVTYEDRNLMDGLEFANGASTDYTYDSLSRLSGIRHGDGEDDAVYDFAIARARTGSVTGLTDTSAGSVDLTATFALDDFYRVTDTTYTGSDEEFTYDLYGRILTSSDGDHTYGASSLAVESVGDLDLSYNAAGQMVTRDDLTFNRDVFGRISVIERGGEEVGRHLYGVRDRVVKAAQDGTLVLYGFDRFEVRDGVSATFVNAGEKRVARHEGVTMAADIYPDAVDDGEINAADAYAVTIKEDEWMLAEHLLAAAASRLLVEQEDANNWMHFDHLGSHVAATDEDGEVRGKQAFLLHGELRDQNGYVGEFGFTGQERDVTTTGLIHMRFRELDPTTGRWDAFDPAFVQVSADAMADFGQAVGGYSYVANAASSFADPSGLGFFKKSTAKKEKNRRANLKKSTAKRDAMWTNIVKKEKDIQNNKDFGFSNRLSSYSGLQPKKERKWARKATDKEAAKLNKQLSKLRTKYDALDKKVFDYSNGGPVFEKNRKADKEYFVKVSNEHKQARMKRSVSRSEVGANAYIAPANTIYY